ncbi:MAG TPA: lipopolysaccharide heptosyltransferase I [Gammaproteobacteria bacterium]|nr:lipopolysaccharide heptosyltransferase I [Gammaproteobacteria bacterium]
MRVLLVKTSSLGDVIHTLPALTDAAAVIPNLSFTWLVEEPFAEIPSWHPRVEKILPLAWRRWRKNLFSKQHLQEGRTFLKALRSEHYDLVLDAQGLVKSALLTLAAKGRRCGLDWRSAREPVASCVYQTKCTVNFYQHAIVRMRSIFSHAFNYDLPTTLPDYGLTREQFINPTKEAAYLVFLHGTTWATKLWPENYWVELAKLAARENLVVKLLWGSALEEARAKRLAEQAENIVVMPRQDLRGSAKVLTNARGIVAVDTGLAHLAAALEVPTVSLYGPTNPEYTGALGRKQLCLPAQFPCAPCLKRECTYQGVASTQPACFSALPPEKVWASLASLISTS